MGGREVRDLWICVREGCGGLEGETTMLFGDDEYEECEERITQGPAMMISWSFEEWMPKPGGEMAVLAGRRRKDKRNGRGFG